MKKLFFIVLILLSILNVTNISAKNYAIIITGETPDGSSLCPHKTWGGPNAQGIYDSFWNDTYLMWETLYKLGFENQNIFVLYGDGTDYQSDYSRYQPQFNFDELTGDITDFPATLTSVCELFEGLKNGNASLGIPQMTSDDFLFVYTFDHGGTIGNCSILCLMDGFYITAGQFARYADDLQYSKRVVFMQQCNSGGFINYLHNVKSVIVTACKISEGAGNADDINPDGADAQENDVYEGNIYHHGEFDYHIFNAVNLQTIVGNNLTNPDIDGNGKSSIEEIFIGII